MKSDQSRAELIALMEQHGLKRADVARLLDLPVKRYSHRSVDRWIDGTTPMPPIKLAYLRDKLSRAPV